MKWSSRNASVAPRSQFNGFGINALKYETNKERKEPKLSKISEEKVQICDWNQLIQGLPVKLQVYKLIDSVEFAVWCLFLAVGWLNQPVIGCRCSLSTDEPHQHSTRLCYFLTEQVSPEEQHPPIRKGATRATCRFPIYGMTCRPEDNTRMRCFHSICNSMCSAAVLHSLTLNCFLSSLFKHTHANIMLGSW